MDGIAQLALTLAVGTVASFAVFKLSVLLYERVKSPLLNPLLVTVAFIIAALVALRIPLDSYEQSVQLISFLLGPATVALAYSVYRQRQTLKEHFVPIFAGCLVGSVVSMASAYALCKLLGLDDALALSFIPKSVTTPSPASWAPSPRRSWRVCSACATASPRAWPSERAATRWERRKPSRWASSKAP